VRYKPPNGLVGMRTWPSSIHQKQRVNRRGIIFGGSKKRKGRALPERVRIRPGLKLPDGKIRFPQTTDECNSQHHQGKKNTRLLFRGIKRWGGARTVEGNVVGEEKI